MKNGICPKCGSSEVYAGTEVRFKQGGYGSNSVPVDFWTFAAKDNYVCGDCGYVESYIAKGRNLQKIRNKWPLVDEQKAKRGDGDYGG